MSFNITVEASGRISFIKRYKDNLSFGVLGSKMEYPYPSNEEFKQMVVSHKDKLGYICPIRICQEKTYSLLEKAQVQGKTIKVRTIFLFTFVKIKTINFIYIFSRFRWSNMSSKRLLFIIKLNMKILVSFQNKLSVILLIMKVIDLLIACILCLRKLFIIATLFQKEKNRIY